MAYAGHPLVGDNVYGRRRDGPAFGRQALHAASLGFRHPITGEALAFEAAVPGDFATLVATLRRSNEVATFNEG
jgi:23S rRNA pseudouridine1911/1915/1917 synthase